MTCWLVKSDPETYAFDDLVRERRARWDGVANALALRHLATMRPGDEVLIYESGKVKAVVGRARVVSDPYPDPAAGNPKLLVVDFEAGLRLRRPVTLAAVRAEPAFAAFELVRQSRLSVMPVPEALWKRLLAMSDVGP